MDTAAGHSGENTNNVDPGGAKHTQNARKQSFASLFKDNRVPVAASYLKHIEPPLGEVIIGGEEIESVEKTFGYFLVGYVMEPCPSPYTVRNFVKRCGGNVKFVFKDNGWIKFQFSSESERDAMLNGGPYLISGRQLFLKQMPSCFLFSKEDMVFLPSWVQIYGRSADCWTAPALSKIASVVGKPIHTDMLTISKKGSTYARVLVELDAKKPRVWEYAVKLPTGKLTLVKFKYELEPKYCDKCNSLGHVADLCGVKIRKKQHTHQVLNPEIKYANVPVDDIQHSQNQPTEIAEEIGGNNKATTSNLPGAEPSCSNTKGNIVPVIDEVIQQPTNSHMENNNYEKVDDTKQKTHKGKSIAATVPETMQQCSDLEKNNNSLGNMGDVQQSTECSSTKDHTPTAVVCEQKAANSSRLELE